MNKQTHIHVYIYIQITAELHLFHNEEAMGIGLAVLIMPLCEARRDPLRVGPYRLSPKR